MRSTYGNGRIRRHIFFVAIRCASVSQTPAAYVVRSPTYEIQRPGIKIVTYEKNVRIVCTIDIYDEHKNAKLVR